jgi:hypothetical protein
MSVLSEANIDFYFIEIAFWQFFCAFCLRLNRSSRRSTPPPDAQCVGLTRRQVHRGEGTRAPHAFTLVASTGNSMRGIFMRHDASIA